MHDRGRPVRNRAQIRRAHSPSARNSDGGTTIDSRYLMGKALTDTVLVAV